MLQKTRTFASSFALLFLLGAIAPASANAWPFGRTVHRHPGVQGQDARITVRLFNDSNRFQEIRVGGHTFTVMPRAGLSIKAPVGTDVFAGTATFFHEKGELLFSMTADRNTSTLTLK